ncbi:MAG: diguanylate cyclase [Arenicellales bacterium]|jgi:diguanylate cyclase (GGDEF)-like protein|nr:diguanylate cyclase [Arenicellales bacterium]|tara:strand:- start:7836 stop:8990 length:1155 start_codon:yes stop_codon:yes gene_type:complete
MRLGIFLKFVLCFVLLAVVLGAAGLLVYKNYRADHYEGVASAQLATAVVGSATVLDQAIAKGEKEAREALSLFSMFPFVLCVEVESSEGPNLRWPPLPCEIIKEQKYPLHYGNILSDGSGLLFHISSEWVQEQVDRELYIGFIALAVFLLLFVVGSGLLFQRIVGHPIGYLIGSLRNISQDLTKQESIRKLTEDEIGELTDALNGLLQRIRTYQAELVRLANTDGLTGIFNRRTFFAHGEELIKSHPQGVYFLLIDLDHFKTINDTYGHAVGDVVLEKVGGLLQGSMRTSGNRLPDIVGRLGGEEFGILISADNIDDAVSVAERLRQTIESTHIETVDVSVSVTGSIGVAEAVVGESLDKLYQRADKACYLAKDNGRNRVEVAD